jgi:hypothetical protein
MHRQNVDHIMMERIRPVDAEKVVISCPRCLRQYDTNKTMSGKLGKCGACKAHFSVAVTEFAASADSAVIFDNPLALRNSLIFEGCLILGLNIRRILMLADVPITPDIVVEITRSLPRCRSDLLNEKWREGRCNQTLKKAHDRTFSTPQAACWESVFEYFTCYIPDRHFDVIDMLSGAFLGVLSEMEFDMPNDAPPTKGPLLPSDGRKWFSVVWNVLRR